MIVLNNKCKICNKICNAIHFQQNFENWTSGNNDINKLIQNIQLMAHDDVKEALEWIPYDRFYNIEYIEKLEYIKQTGLMVVLTNGIMKIKIGKDLIKICLLI
jgi:hypothetical protein